MDVNAISTSIKGIDLAGKTVVIRKSALGLAWQDGDRRFKAQAGFGCKPHAMGRGVFGDFVCDGEHARIDRDDIEGIAEHQL
jgi:hypothetical protein